MHHSHAFLGLPANARVTLVAAIAGGAIAASCAPGSCETIVDEIALDEAVGYPTRIEALRESGSASELGVPSTVTLDADGRTILDVAQGVGTADFIELGNGNFVTSSITYCG